VGTAQNKSQVAMASAYVLMASPEASRKIALVCVPGGDVQVPQQAQADYLRLDNHMLSLQGAHRLHKQKAEKQMLEELCDLPPTRVQGSQAIWNPANKFLHKQILLSRSIN